ncbi:MAG: hypothetical protein ACREDQ_10370, partial [Limisphaerales bacterium]
VGWGEAFHEPVCSVVVATAGYDSVSLSEGTPGGTPGWTRRRGRPRYHDASHIYAVESGPNPLTS